MKNFYQRMAESQEQLFAKEKAEKKARKSTLKNIANKIAEWNTIANNGVKPEPNRHLETSMLHEEVAELGLAMKKNDKVEQLDAICDIIFVALGTACKLDFTPEQIRDALREVIRSNYTKFQTANNEWGYEAHKDNTGKVIKPFTYEEPNLEEIVYGKETK